MMDVSEYLELKSRYYAQFERQTGGLFQCGDGHDNNFRDLGRRNVRNLICSYQGVFGSSAVCSKPASVEPTDRRSNHGIFDYSLIKGKHYEGDFVMNSQGMITVPGHLLYSGGHPGLTQEGYTECAGRIKQDSFFFHSGHFKPKACNIIQFMFQFIDNSLNDHELAGEKQKCLTFLGEQMLLELYYDDSSQSSRKKIEKSFSSLCEYVLENGSFNKITHSKLLDRSNLTQRGGLSRSTPTTTSERRCLMDRNRIKGVRPARIVGRWQLNSSSDTCGVCNQIIESSFCEMKSNKHHCRVCGEIICGKCYTKANVPRPLSGKGSLTKSGVHHTKVCNNCNFRIQK